MRKKNDFKDPCADKASAFSEHSCKAASAADSVTAPAASSNTFYIPPSGNYEDDDRIDDDIMFHGGNPFDWDTRSDYLDDPFGFGGDDGDGGEDW